MLKISKSLIIIFISLVMLVTLMCDINMLNEKQNYTHNLLKFTLIKLIYAAVVGLMQNLPSNYFKILSLRWIFMCAVISYFHKKDECNQKLLKEKGQQIHTQNVIFKR